MARPPVEVEEWSSRRYRESKRFKSAAKKLGLRVRELREQRGLTLERAAELAEMDLTHWQKVEAGTLNPTLVTVLRIADSLGVPLDAIFRAPGSDRPAGARTGKSLKRRAPSRRRRT